MFVGYLSINFFPLTVLALKKMARGYEVFQKFEKDKSQVPTQATPHSAVYNLYAPKVKTIFPKDLGFYGKIFSRSGLLVRHLITAEGGVIDSDH